MQRSEGSGTHRLRTIAVIVMPTLAALLLVLGHVNTVRNAELRLARFERPYIFDPGSRRPAVAIVEPSSPEFSLFGVPKVGDMIDLSTGEHVKGHHVAKFELGDIWESTDGKAVQLAGGVLYNLMNNPVYPALSFILLALTATALPGAFNRG